MNRSWAVVPRVLCCARGAGAVGRSLSQGLGVSWPLKLLPQGNNKNRLTVVFKATCEVWAEVVPSAAPSSSRIAQQGFSDCVPQGMWNGLGESSWGSPKYALKGTFESKLSPLLLILISWKGIKCPPSGHWTPSLNTGHFLRSGTQFPE